MIRSLTLFTLILPLWLFTANVSNVNASEDNKKQSTEKASEKKTQIDKSIDSSDDQDQPAQKPIDSKDEKTAEDEIDWGAWSTTNYGVGIQGKIEAELNALDQSNLIDEADGVAVEKITDNHNTDPAKRDLKKMMAELEAMEEKVSQEIEDDKEF